jgi:hypothetical protein
VEWLVFGGLVALVALVGIAIGLAVAGRLDRRMARDDAAERLEDGAGEGANAADGGHGDG